MVLLWLKTWSTHTMASSNIQHDLKEALLYSYSNRARAKLMLKEFLTAVEDCDKALDLDSEHLKPLCCKGRALHTLGKYSLACECFERALQHSPTTSDIESLYHKSKKFNDQNIKGMFDLSTYFLSGCRPQDVLVVCNYIGPVVIKRSSTKSSVGPLHECSDCSSMLVDHQIPTTHIPQIEPPTTTKPSIKKWK
ncbi:hypothetical protein SUGI_0949270 [Cryptomeria japonica]|nr:hypothetical protein SUGI_0949270 [Cryptomeria japonica]